MFSVNRLDLGFDFEARLDGGFDTHGDPPVTTSALTAGSPVGAPVTSTLGTPHTIFPGNVDTMPIIDQGDTNGCGTTSLAMILSHLHNRPYTREEIDAAIRRTDVFTSPQHIVQYSRNQGLASEGYNHGSAEELRGFIDQGIPVQLIVSADGSGDVGKLHYVAVVGYYTDPAGNMTGVRVHNSGTGQVEDWDMNELEQKWGNAKPSFDHFFIAHAPGGTDLPPGRWEGMEGIRLFALGVGNLTNNWDRIVDPDSPGDFTHGILGIHNSAEQVAVGTVAAGGQIGIDYAQEQVGKVPVLRNAVLPQLDVVEGGWQGATNLATGYFQQYEHGAAAIGKLVDGDFGGALEETGKAVVAPIEGAVDAVGSVVGGGVKAVKDFFSGW
jgi:hypothetical protein